MTSYDILHHVTSCDIRLHQFTSYHITLHQIHFPALIHVLYFYIFLPYFARPSLPFTSPSFPSLCPCLPFLFPFPPASLQQYWGEWRRVQGSSPPSCFGVLCSGSGPPPFFLCVPPAPPDTPRRRFDLTHQVWVFNHVAALLPHCSPFEYTEPHDIF